MKKYVVASSSSSSSSFFLRRTTFVRGVVSWFLRCCGWCGVVVFKD